MAATGHLDMGEISGTDESIVVMYDVRPYSESSFIKPEDEDELRGYMEDEYVIAVLSSMKVEAD